MLVITGPSGNVGHELVQTLLARPGLLRFATRLRRRGVGWDTIGFMAAVYTLTRLGENQPVTTEVQHLLGRPPRTLEQFLADSAWRWEQRAWT